MEQNYWFLRLGQNNSYADICFRQNLVAVGWHELDVDLGLYNGLEKRDFMDKLSALLDEAYKQDKNNIQLGISAGQLYIFATLMQVGDIVLTPTTEDGVYYLGVIKSDYRYEKNDDELSCFHRRDVEWVKKVSKSQLSNELRSSISPSKTIFSINGHADEIEVLTQQTIAESPILEDLHAFGIEKALEEFIVRNWSHTILGKDYDIYQEDGLVVGNQYVTAFGRIDILAKSKDDKTWLVIELKEGRSGDVVVGQIARYIGYVKNNLAKSGENIRGIIITGKDDDRLRLAVSVIPDVTFMTYKVNFSLDTISG